jgi:hypothetical protein
MTREYPGGEPEHEPTEETRQKVIDLSCNGFNQTDIADHLDIDDKTLRKHYRVELNKAKREKTLILGNSLYQDAVNGNEQAREFWLKCQARWAYAKPPEDDKPTKMESLLEKLIDKL